MARVHNLGLPRMGARRELKLALESFWRGASDAGELKAEGARLREENWARQRAAGHDWVTCGDFAFYDQMLNVTALLGALPERFGFDPKTLDLTRQFELARGNAAQPAMEMTKWFDTNYHYLVPELGPHTRFDGGIDSFFEEIAAAQALGHAVKPVLIGPVTYLWLSKSTAAHFERLSLLPALVKAYARILARLLGMGIEWVQIDEPALCLDLEPEWLNGLEFAYAELTRSAPKLLLATYFGALAASPARISALPVGGFHIDLVHGLAQLDAWLNAHPPAKVLSVGIVDGRNIWRTDLRRALATLNRCARINPAEFWIAPSSSLLHVPYTIRAETQLDPGVRSWLAFAEEKLHEVTLLGRAVNFGLAAIESELAASDAAQSARQHSPRVANKLVRQKLAALPHQLPGMAHRASDFATRRALQQAVLGLPLFPTTTIGSFPQTSEIRRTRAAYKRGAMGALQYLEATRGAIEAAVRTQEALGLDVLVHGEAERNDMVEYFAELLWGYAISEHGWVQSFGSRCVKPPILFGDVYRPDPMTVETTRYAQSLTDKPMKGMLTGPVTMLQWSFVRDDQPREDTAMQLALAIRQEVADLEKAGVRIIQIDEPALREGLPLRRRQWPAYLEWAVRAFRISSAGVGDTTQIHTHMCYAEFSDILASIAALDADVITIETARSNMVLLDDFARFAYPNDIGPGIYDIHSPRVPSEAEMLDLIVRAAAVIPCERLWVNPDCGLKTRGWAETELALSRMVGAARAARQRYAAGRRSAAELKVEAGPSAELSL